MRQNPAEPWLPDLNPSHRPKIPGLRATLVQNELQPETGPKSAACGFQNLGDPLVSCCAFQGGTRAGY